jgi:hypothetical protein
VAVAGWPAQRLLPRSPPSLSDPRAMISAVLLALLPAGAADDAAAAAGIFNSDDDGPQPPKNTDWFLAAQRGVFTHYLDGLQSRNGSNAQGNVSASWSDTVDAFDAEAYAASAAATGARYAIITMMQGSKSMLGPNSVYDKLTGYKPGEACSKRDLVLDIHAALAKRQMKLLLYWTGDGPHEDAQASSGMGMPLCPNAKGQPDCRSNVPLLFAQQWASVLEEYAVRYGSKVEGWWVDGCYKYFNYTDEKLWPYHVAIKKGNPDAMAAFNTGVTHPISAHKRCTGPLTSPVGGCYSRWEDITNGESDDFSDVPTSRSVDGIQWHTLGYLGNSWAAPGVSRYNASAMRAYSATVARGGGVLSVDLQLLRNGSMNAAQVALLAEAWRGLTPNLSGRPPSIRDG